MKHLSAIFPILPLSFVMLLFSLELSIIDDDSDDELYDYEKESSIVKVAIIEDKAYWVSDNVFYESEYVDDEIVRENARPVDVFNMNFRDASKMMIILDSIQDWEE